MTLQPLRRYDLDASIVFADILVVPHAMGCDLDFLEGEGPRLSVVNGVEATGALKPVAETWQVARVCDTVRQVRQSLDQHVALIGFCGAPWTVASYMIEGSGTAERLNARRAAMEQPQWFRDVMAMLVVDSIDYLCAQVAAGADAVQIFESWGGDVPWPLQQSLIYAPMRAIRDGVRARCGDVPVIAFVRGAGQGHVTAAAAIDANAIGLEQGVDMAWAAREVPCAIQGNLDPVALAVGGDALDSAIDRIVAAVPRQKHIFNLGHGIRQETSPLNVERMVARVRQQDGLAG